MIKLISFLQKIILNPYFGVSLSLLIMTPSLYIILEDITVIRKEYIFLAIGLPIYIKSLNRIFDDIINGNKNHF